MSIPNGLQSQTAAVDFMNAAQSIGKRKRSHDTEDVKPPAAETDYVDDGTSKQRFQDLLLDLLEILKRRDTTPSILHKAITSAASQPRSTKRPKTSAPTTETSISAQIVSSAYSTIDELIADVDTASSALKNSPNKPGLTHSNPYPTPPSGDENVDSPQVKVFKKELKDVLSREMLQRPQNLGPRRKSAIDTSESRIGSVLTSSRSGSISRGENIGKSVLTLYGSAPTPKQLFSSLQQSTSCRLLRDSESCQQGTSHSLFQSQHDIGHQSLRESALPNGISTTRIIPVHTSSLDNTSERVPTLGESFPAPSSILPLNPPKQSRHTATRSQSVNWHDPSEVAVAPRSRGRESYTAQPLSSGQWLTYNVAPSDAQLASPGEKRKQRERALSFGEAKPSIPQETLLAQQQAKEDALFKSVYSSFAPDHDDSAAVIPQDTKNRLWWKRVCEDKYDTYETSLPNEQYKSGTAETAEAVTNDHGEDELFREAVEQFMPLEVPAGFQPSDEVKERETQDKNVDEILNEISELIETMSSYQRARNLSLSTTTRATAGQNSQVTAMFGSPTTPSSAEFNMYDILKSQLSLMVSSLPPYAVAKLNGDQLGALNISTKLPAVTKNYRGTMDDNEAFKARPTTVTTTSAASIRTPVSHPSIPARSGYYQPTAGSPAQRASYSSRPNAPSATYPSQYSGRPSSASQSTSYNTYTASQTQSSAVRNSYSVGQYGQQTPQAQTPHYANGHRQYPTQNGYSHYGQQFAGPQSVGSSAQGQGPQYQRPSQPSYQQRAQNSQTYSYGPVATGRSASPANPATAYSPPRASYSTPGQGQVRAQYYQAQSQPSATNANALQLNGTIGTVGTVGQHIHLTAEEQAMLMSRQKAQLAQQVQLNSARQGSGTPQPPMSGGQSNGTVAPQQNGVTVEKV